MTTLPTWAVYVVSFGSPTAAFLAALLGIRLTRRSADQLDRRSKREETMRTLRWAGELTVSGDQAKARLGMAALDALSNSPWLQPEDQTFIDGALATLLPVDLEAYRDPRRHVPGDGDGASSPGVAPVRVQEEGQG